MVNFCRVSKMLKWLYGWGDECWWGFRELLARPCSFSPHDGECGRCELGGEPRVGTCFMPQKGRRGGDKLKKKPVSFSFLFLLHKMLGRYCGECLPPII